MKHHLLLAFSISLTCGLLHADGISGKKPNIIVLWGDDIGVHNISAYNHGIIHRKNLFSKGRQTPPQYAYNIIK